MDSGIHVHISLCEGRFRPRSRLTSPRDHPKPPLKYRLHLLKGEDSGRILHRTRYCNLEFALPQTKSRRRHQDYFLISTAVQASQPPFAQ